MSFNTLRCVHASGLRLDRQPQGLGPLPAPVREQLLTASLTAWNRLVDVCLEESADVLLLAGDTLDDPDLSPAALDAFLTGAARLADAGIPICAVAGPADSSAAWDLVAPDLPETFFRLDAGETDEVEITRDDRTVALVSLWDARRAPSRAKTGGPVSLVLVPESASGDGPWQAAGDPAVHYWALGGGPARSWTLDRGVAARPGPLVGLRATESGPQGATLVESDSAGRLQLRTIPLAPIRWETLALTLPPQATVDDLLTELPAAVKGLRAQPGETLWLLDWDVRGPATLAAECRDAGLTAELADDLWRTPLVGGIRVWSHAFRFTAEGTARRSTRPLAERLESPEFLARCERQLLEVGGAALADLFDRLDREAVERAAAERLVPLEPAATREAA